MRAWACLLVLVFYAAQYCFCLAEPERMVLDEASAVADPPYYSYNFTQVVESHGYPCEMHRAVTSDGYILTLFRIPPKPSNAGRPPILLQHGLLDSAFTWIVNQPTQSLPYILHDAGFDVWMGNNRGNIYSQAHVKYTPADNQFWEFSWDDMAQYDLPGMLSYILKVTGHPKLAYIGHSQGSIQMFAALSSNIPLPLTTFIGLGPVASVAHINNWGFRFLAETYIDNVVAGLGFHNFLPKVNGTTNPLLLKLFVTFCSTCEVCCANVIELICGPHRGAFNDTLMPWVVINEPGGTSVKNMQHWAQGIRQGKFQKFDYGAVGNLERYGQLTPPAYNLSAIPKDIPLAMYSGGNDLLADPTDVANLIKQLPAGTYWHNIADYAHLDFTWAIDAFRVLYPDIISKLTRWNV
jgi:pimeloyl-ACP methyl ester carboxylesterase